ncbi:coiled-coil domain-containing protein 169 isoform X2 [Nothobranchius furzeri]|uniref:Transcript variant X2 n=1 Tax=Nothobranchius furzeri TaxID=105023 RepID=A0A9D3BGA8_NOTFU|nr:coiled-coil domain containing 169 isoform X2 [Nothobranchius furzeri]KAF7206425.1 transcript variant X2 [Nothobranchius furzeri]
MAKEDYSKYSLSRLHTELQEEREIREMLEESVSDLRRTSSELQDRLHCVDGEGNEWKTRYETQLELNGQLERQISLIQDKLEDIRGNPIDRLAFIRSYEDMAVENLKHHLKLLTKQKTDLQSRLMDCHLLIEQEGKLTSIHETQRGKESSQRQKNPANKSIRGKQTSKKSPIKSNKEKEEEGDGIGGNVNVGGGGGDSTTERGVKKIPQREKLPAIYTSYFSG